MKTSALSLACVLAVTALSGCKPAAENQAVAPAEPAPVAPADIQAVPATSAMVEIPVASEAGVPHLLAAASAVSGAFSAPQAGDVHAVGIQIGNFGGTADGTASLKVCQSDKCQEATAEIAGSADNSYLQFQLPAPLTVAAGSAVTYTFTRVGGVQPFAVWSYPTSTNGELTLPDTTKAARDAKIALTF